MYINNFMSPSFVMQRTFTIVAAAGLAMGGAKLIAGGIQRKNAKKRQDAAKEQMEKNVDKYMNREIKNPYENMENLSEDLTVNTQEAEFKSKKQDQARADTMESLRGAAGGSGIAALAQSMANQASQDAQSASTSIAAQELQNQKAERAEAGNIRDMQIQGDILVDKAQQDRLATQIGMDQAEVTAETEAVNAANEMMMSGVSDIGSTVAGM